MPLDLQSFSNSVTSLSNLLAVSESDGRMLRLGEVERDGIRAGVMQNFEVTYELAWKLMSRWLSENVGRTVVDGVTRRHLFRLAAEHCLIEDVDGWMRHQLARNQTSHMYNQEVAARVYAAAGQFALDAHRLLSALEARAMIDLDPRHLATVHRILREHVPDCEVRAFGSRVTGGARRYSDLDLAIIGDEPLGLVPLGLLKEAFEESSLPIRVDVIDWHDTSESFRKVIEGDCVTLSRGGGVSEPQSA